MDFEVAEGRKQSRRRWFYAGYLLTTLIRYSIPSGDLKCARRRHAVSNAGTVRYGCLRQERLRKMIDSLPENKPSTAGFPMIGEFALQAHKNPFDDSSQRFQS
jgi:hypothetical protein